MKPADRVKVAAYLVDRADQYETKSPCWVALCDAAKNIVNGAVEVAEDNGDLDSDLRRRVRGWIGAADAGVMPTAGVEACRHGKVGYCADCHAEFYP